MDRDTIPGALLLVLGVLLVLTALAYPLLERPAHTLEVGPVEDRDALVEETDVWTYGELSPTARQAFDAARENDDVGRVTIYGDGNVPTEFEESRVEFRDSFQQRGGYVEDGDRTYLVRIVDSESARTPFVLPLGFVTGAALAVVGYRAATTRERIVPTVLLVIGAVVLYWLLVTANVHGLWTPVGG